MNRDRLDQPRATDIDDDAPASKHPETSSCRAFDLRDLVHPNPYAGQPFTELYLESGDRAFVLRAAARMDRWELVDLHATEALGRRVFYLLSNRQLAHRVLALGRPVEFTEDIRIGPLTSIVATTGSAENPAPIVANIRARIREATMHPLVKKYHAFRGKRA